MLLETDDKSIHILLTTLLGCKSETQFPPLGSEFKSILPAYSCHLTVGVLKWAWCQSLLWVDYLSVYNRQLGWFYYLLFCMLYYRGNHSKVVLGFSFFGFCFALSTRKAKKYFSFFPSDWGFGCSLFSFGHYTSLLKSEILCAAFLKGR